MSTLEVKAIQAPTGYKLAMPAGHILQVVSADYVTEGNSTSTSFVSIGLTATITPSTTSSKIIILASPTVWGDRTGNAENLTKLAIYKGSSILADSETGVSIIRSTPNFLSKSVIEFPTYQGLQSPWPITKTSGYFSNKYSNAERIAVP